MNLNLKSFVCLGLTLVVFWVSTCVAEPPKRPFYEYKGNYEQETNTLKQKFQQSFGYELVDFGQPWRPPEIEKLHGAFTRLPETFYRLPGLKALYRLSRFQTDSPDLPAEEIPAAALPGFLILFEQESRSYKALINNQDPRVEFYNSLFYEDEEDFANIVHHEMAHAFDMLKGFPSFSKEWIRLTAFRTIHQPALDHKPGSDFLFVLLNDSKVDRYAPISTRHLPTYSRQNIQEDFANSAAAYIHYPYFRYSHPGRYRFLKERVFGGREYFPVLDGNSNFQKIIEADFKEASEKKDWQRVRGILIELSRAHFPDIESTIVKELRKTLQWDPVVERDRQLGVASCFLIDSGALEFRKDLIRKKRVTVEGLLKDERCSRVGRDNFEKNLVHWTPANTYYYREGDRDIIQFLDPVHEVAYSRGFHTRYIWRIFQEGSGNKPLYEGNINLAERGNGSIKIALAESAGKKLLLPPGRPLILELGTQRFHPRSFKIFNSPTTRIRFVIHPEFNYTVPEVPEIRVIYPFRPAYQHLN